MLNVAILGIGNISKAHISGWEHIPEANISALCDIRPDQMTEPAKKTGAKTYTSYDEMLDNEKIDIIDICLPTHLHVDAALKAIRRKINVLLEKPLSLNESDIDLVYSEAEKHGVKIMVAQVVRFWKEYCYLKEIYENKTYGKLLSGNMYRLGNTPRWSWENWMLQYKLSGYVPFDLHIHDLDYIVHTFGEPKKVDSFRGLGDKQDYVKSIYSFDGFFISAEAGWFYGDYAFRSGFRFQFEKAMIVKEGKDTTIYHQDGRVEPLNVDELKIQTGGQNIPGTSAYYNEIRYFTDCVLNNAPVDRVKKEELKTVLRIASKI